VKFLPVFAQQEGAPAAPAGEGAPAGQGGQPAAGGMSSLMQFAPFVLIGLFFLVVLLPAQRRRKKEEAERLAKMRPGAKVILNSGIVGKIVTIKDGEDEIVIKSDDTKLRVLKAAVASVTDESAPATTEPAKS
jgi:preprotein translocase subunit YajC